MDVIDLLLGLVILAVIFIIVHWIYTLVTAKPEEPTLADKYELAWSQVISKCQLDDLTSQDRIRPYTLESNIYSDQPAAK